MTKEQIYSREDYHMLRDNAAVDATADFDALVDERDAVNSHSSDRPPTPVTTQISTKTHENNFQKQELLARTATKKSQKHAARQRRSRGRKRMISTPSIFIVSIFFFWLSIALQLLSSPPSNRRINCWTAVGFTIQTSRIKSTQNPRFKSVQAPLRLMVNATSTEAVEDDDNYEVELEKISETAATSARLLELLRPSSSCRVNQMSGTDLAYVGDVVYELFIRSRCVWPSKRTSDLQDEVVGFVRAEYQSKLLECIRESFPLSSDENKVLMRGRNSVTRSAKNRKNPAAYQDSTAVETLIGYLFIKDPDRCSELLRWIEGAMDGIK